MNDVPRHVISNLARHVGEQVHGVVKHHGMTMPTVAAAAEMGAIVAANLAIEVGLFAGLSAYDEDWPDRDIEGCFQTAVTDALDTIAELRPGGLKRLFELVAERRRLGQ